MSDYITAESLRSAFPESLSTNEAMAVLASLVAEELSELNEKTDKGIVYARIDNLDEPMLDILAKDFKVDWWDADAELDEKRQTLKSCFAVHRKLGTPQAVKDAISSIYANTDISEWFEYNGLPYHYKINIDLEDELMDEDKFQRVLSRARFYVNVRSVLDAVSFTAEKRKNIFVGFAIQNGCVLSMNVPGLPEGLQYYVNALGDPYTDANGYVYTSGGEIST